jgi:hypothetical protein
MLPQRKTRTFRSFVLRALVPRVVAFGGCAVFLAVGQAMAADGAATAETVIAEQAIQAPSWTIEDAASFPGCVASSEWEAGTPAPAVVVQGVESSAHRRIGLARAWDLNHNATESDDVWVLGICA